jgi:hypothetical protein
MDVGMNKIEETLDEITRKYTAFESFEDMVNAEGNYRPTLRTESVEELKILADFYDKVQEDKGDPRRVFRTQ